MAGKKHYNGAAERYAKLFQESTDAIFIHDLKGKIRDVNPRAAKLFGYTKKRLLRMNIADLHPKSARPRSKEAFKEISKEGSVKFEADFLQKGGKIFRAKISAIMFKLSGRDVIQGIVTDITEIRETKEALESIEISFEKLVNASPFGIHMYELEPDGKLIIIGANPAADKILGIKNKQFIGKTIEEAFYPVKKSEIPKKYKEIAKNGKSWQTQYKYLENVYDVYAFQTSPNRMAAAFIDITNRLKAEQERLELCKIREINDLKDELFMTTAHELKTPLTPIKMESDMWLKDKYGGMSDRQEQSMLIISRNAKRMIKLIDDIQIITRIDQDLLEYDFRIKDIRPILRNIGSDMKVAALEKGLSLEIKMPSNPLKARIDPLRITQVLANLVDNSLRYTEKGGIIISASKIGKNLKISVKDTGIGIAKSEQGNIFKRFYQVKGVNEGRYGGTGLGLSIAKSMIEKQGGRMWADSKLGKGSTFYFTLPLYTSR